MKPCSGRCGRCCGRRGSDCGRVRRLHAEALVHHPVGQAPAEPRRSHALRRDLAKQGRLAGCGTTYKGPHPAPFQPASSLTVDDARSARRLCLNASEGRSTTSPAFDPEPVPRALIA